MRAFAHLRAHGRTVLIACAVAVACSLSISLLLPKKYTAICRILIETPGGNDVRVATAVSPVYLESLRTYELFASSDDLFLRAVQRFGLRDDSTSLDRLKKSVLKVDIPRSTKVLELYATLPDPAKAHALAVFLGEQTVALSRSVGQAGEREMTGAAERDTARAWEHFQQTERTWAEAMARGPIETLTADLEAELDLRSRLRRQLVAAEADASDQQAVPLIRREVDDLDGRIAAKQKLFGERAAVLDRLNSERKSAEADYQAANRRLQDLRAGEGRSSERLSIIDPGVVPERPSWPNIPLNVTVAALAALALSLLWVLVSFGYGNRQYETSRLAPRRRGAA